VDTARNGVETFKKIMALRSDYDQTILTFGRRAQHGNTLLHHLFAMPIIDVKGAAEVCKVSFNTANTLLQQMTEKGMLREMTGLSRNRLFSLHEYLALFR
jgi:Fic family protein